MKKYILTAILAVALLGFGAARAASGLYPLPAEAMAKYGATHEFVASFSDLTAATNTAQTLTFAVEAKQAVALVGFVLDEAFDDGSALTTNSLALTIGDGTDADLYLTSTELASDGTEVFFKFAPIGTVTITATSATAVAVSALGQKVYTADDTVDFVFTPDSLSAPADFTVGKLRALFRILP